MTADSTPTEPVTELPSPEADSSLQVRFKNQDGNLLLYLPPDTKGKLSPLSWPEVLEQLRHRLTTNERFWQPETLVYLITRDRLLDTRQLQEIVNVLAEAKLRLSRVYTSRRQTAVAAATAGYSVEQQTPANQRSSVSESTAKPLDEPLYMQGTIRSGVEIRHAGTVIILGDINPGGSIVAEGDIIVWGRLRGLAHAGCNGKTDCRIMALRMEPTQLRIADKVARPPATPPTQYFPEVAYIGNEGIRIGLAKEFTPRVVEEQS